MVTQRQRAGLREIRARVRAYVVNSFLAPAEAETVRDDDDLLAILDSLQILRLVLALESAFGVKVPDGELTPENLGLVRRVADLIAGKLRGHGRTRRPARSSRRKG